MKYSIVIFFFFGCLLMVNNDAVSASKLNDAVFQTGRKDSVMLENDFVRVMKNGSIKTAADAAIFGKRIIVALTKLSYKNVHIRRTIERGVIVVFLPGEFPDIKKGDYFEVAFKKNHPEPKGPQEWLEPQKNKIVYEDELFRVFEERLAAGDTRVLHSHAQRVVVRLNNVQLTDPRINPNGIAGEGIQIPNTVKFAEPMVHVVKNLSRDTPLFNIIIEFKTTVYNNAIK